MPPESTPDASVGGEPFELAAERPVVAGSRVRYPKPLDHYAALYDCSVRTIKRMIERGRRDGDALRDPVDLPPLHRPEKMPEWWERRMDYRCPAGVLNASSKAARCSRSREKPRPADPSPEVSVTPAPKDPPEPSALAAATPLDRTGLDIEQNTEQLRQSLANARRALELAELGEDIEGVRKVDENLVARRGREYRETFSELRKAETDLLAWKEKTGRLADREIVRAENNRIAAAIFRAVSRLAKDLRPKIAGKPDAEQDRIWSDGVHACFAALKGADFVDPI